MRKIFEKFSIDHYAFVSADILREANSRLFSQMPDGAQVIFMLFPYYCGDCDKKISAYGAVYDYHHFAKNVFSLLEEHISKKYPERFVRGFADHSPYLECEGAAMAGLGVMGKNSLLITKKYSSYVFIGELVTTLTKEELTLEGIPEGNGKVQKCIGCSACETACPSDCIRLCDRSFCLSSISQKKGELSIKEAAFLKEGKSIWGCDKCQQVCPYTQAAIENGTICTPIEFFKDSYIGKDPAKAIREMNDEVFSRYPFAWRKRKTVERNIAIIEDTLKTDEKDPGKEH